MASQSPGLENVELTDYRQSWLEVSQAMNAGMSWSGHERNSAWVQSQDGRFVQVAGALGFDFDQDGRSLARVDWDGDGDLDLLLRSRSEPGLRYLENQTQGPRVLLRVQTPKPQRDGVAGWVDAIGARLHLKTQQRQWMHEIHAGEGYLAQSEPVVAQALEPGEVLQSVTVFWPNGDRDHWEADVTGSWTKAQRVQLFPGGWQALAEAPQRPPLAAGALTPQDPAMRTVLRAPLPWLEAQENNPPVDPASGRILAVLADSEPSREAWLAWQSDLGEAGWPVEVHAPLAQAPHASWINVSPEARQAHRIILKSCVEFAPFPQQPAVLLLDAHGAVQVIYWERPSVETLQADWERFVAQRIPGAQRGAWPGSWFHGSDRDWKSLALELHAQGLAPWARLYAQLARR